MSEKKPDKESSAWRETTMSQIRKLIKQAAPNVDEQQKYKKPSNPSGIPVWYHEGMIMTGETYKEHLRLGFAKRLELKNNHDPMGLINSQRAIIIKEDDKLDEAAFKKLIKVVVQLNQEK